MQNERTLHEVDGYVIEVVPDPRVGCFAASIMEGSTKLRISVNEEDEVVGSGVGGTVADHEQLDPWPEITAKHISAMLGAIKQRRSGEVVPEDLPPTWLDE